MVNIDDGKIGRREWLALIFFMIGIKYKDATPDVLYTVGEQAAWMIPLITLCIYTLPLALLIQLMKKHRIGFTELVYKMMGNYVGTFVVAFLFLIFFVGVINNYRGHIEIINTFIFPKTPIGILFIVIVLASYYVSKQGLVSVGSLSWLLFIPLNVLMTILVIISWKEIKWGYVFPIMGPGLFEVMKASFTYSSMFGEVILLTVFYSYLRSDKDLTHGAIIGNAMSVIQVSLFLVLLVLVFDYPGVDRMNFPYQQLTRYVSIGEVVSHLEGVFIGFWSIVTTLHFAIYLLLSAFLLASTLRLKRMTTILPMLCGLVFFIGLLPENAFTTMGFRKMLVTVGSWLLIVLPILLWVGDQWKERLQK